MTDYDLIYGYLLGKAVELLQMEFDLFGHVVSFWQAFIFLLILDIVGMILFEILH